MERLTRQVDLGNPSPAWITDFVTRIPFGPYADSASGHSVDQLAAYENTGLTPAEIAAMQAENKRLKEEFVEAKDEIARLAKSVESGEIAEAIRNNKEYIAAMQAENKRLNNTERIIQLMGEMEANGMAEATIRTLEGKLKDLQAELEDLRGKMERGEETTSYTQTGEYEGTCQKCGAKVLYSVPKYCPGCVKKVNMYARAR